MAILNGTFSKWAAEGRKTEDGDTEKAWKKYLPSDIKLQPSDFDFLCDNTRVRDYKEIVRISNFNLVASDTKGPDAIKIIDTRLDVTYDLGHIPSSINIPFVKMLNPDKTFKSEDKLREIFINAGISKPESQPIILSCNRGISACVLDAALRLLGNPNVSVYDGSFEEYARK